VRVWEASSGKALHVLKGHKGWVRTVAYSPDGARVVSGADDGTVRVWEASSGKALHVLKGHMGGVSTVAYSPDGARVASVAGDGTMRVWALSPAARGIVLMGEGEEWVALAQGTPFFIGEGDALLHYTSGAYAMTPTLWRPLFHRPELISEALAGKPLDMKALGLDTFESCVQALQVERQRQGLARKRTAQQPFQSSTVVSPEPPPELNLSRSQFMLGIMRGGSRPLVHIRLRASGVSAGMRFAASLQFVGAQRLAAVRVELKRDEESLDKATLDLHFDVPGPGGAVLTVTSLPVLGREHPETFGVSFEPENPFIMGSFIENPRDFYGRSSDLAEVLSHLEQGSVALLGERRIGKTSLLHHLEHRLPGRCEQFVLQEDANYLEAIPSLMAAQLAPGGKRGANDWETLDHAVSARLDALGRSHGPGTCFMILVDEAQFLASTPRVWQGLRAVLQKRQRQGLRAVLAGPVVEMRELGKVYKGSPLLNIFETHRLGPMSPEEIRGLLSTPLGDEYTVTEEAVSRVVAWSGGRPLIAQKLGGEALKRCRGQRRFRIEAEDIDQVFRDKVFASLIHTSYGYPSTWESFPEEVREVLRGIAKRPGTEQEELDSRTLGLLDKVGLAGVGHRRLEVAPPFLHWIREVAP
jgi:hypothetical protein